MPHGTDDSPVTNNTQAGDAIMFAKPALAPTFGGFVLQLLFGTKTGSATATTQAAPSVSTDIAEQLSKLVGRTGSIVPVMGGFHIRVNLAATFPFATVLTALLHRNFRVDVVQREAGLLIEARP